MLPIAAHACRFKFGEARARSGNHAGLNGSRAQFDARNHPTCDDQRAERVVPAMCRAAQPRPTVNNRMQLARRRERKLRPLRACAGKITGHPASVGLWYGRVRCCVVSKSRVRILRSRSISAPRPKRRQRSLVKQPKHYARRHRHRLAPHGAQTGAPYRQRDRAASAFDRAAKRTVRQPLSKVGRGTRRAQQGMRPGRALVCVRWRASIALPASARARRPTDASTRMVSSSRCLRRRERTQGRAEVSEVGRKKA